MPDQNYKALLLLPILLFGLWLRDFFSSLTMLEMFFAGLAIATLILIAGYFAAIHSSKWGRDRKKRLATLSEIPNRLLRNSGGAVEMGVDVNLEAKIFLPDNIRTRHVHILGATGSGKTESVVLNFLRQDVARGLGSIILDAKGDASFLSELKQWVPKERLRLFDLSDPESTGFNPLEQGSPLESAQRLFSSLTWSEEYYKSKALSALQRLFQAHYENYKVNPRLSDLASYLEFPDSYSSIVESEGYPHALALKDFQEISGLRDQVRSLTIAHLTDILSPKSDNESAIKISEARAGIVIYFRLQSLMSPQIVSTLGKLIINQLNFLAGTAHREQVEADAKVRKLVPVYLDEFASFACAEFADLISKARSAGFALHFAHQSIGDVVEVSPSFLNRITDNSATKIIMRINDPESADFFARSFGTRLYQKATQRVTNAKDIDTAEVLEEGTIREAHQFRASPDLLKTLPTGMGAVLVAHGDDTPHGGSSVFTIRFPELKRQSEIAKVSQIRCLDELSHR